MISIKITFSEGDGLEKKQVKMSRKKILVRGHFRNVNGKRTYVKAHYRTQTR